MFWIPDPAWYLLTICSVLWYIKGNLPWTTSASYGFHVLQTLTWSDLLSDLLFRELNEKFEEAGFSPIQHTFDVWHLCKVNFSMYLMNHERWNINFLTFRSGTRTCYNKSKKILWPTKSRIFFEKFMFWNVWWPLFIAEGFFCNLNFLFGGLVIQILQL